MHLGNEKTSRNVWKLVGASLLAIAAIVVLKTTADPAPDSIIAPKMFGLWKGRASAVALMLVALAVGLACVALSRNVGYAYVGSSLCVVGTILVLEAVGQMGLINWPRLLTVKMDPLTKIGLVRSPNVDISGISTMETAPQFGMKAEAIPYHYKTDRHGFRNATDRTSASIYLLGDSMLVNTLLRFDQTIAGRLEHVLGKPIIQVALLGHGPQDEQDLFRETGLGVNGSLVVQFVFEGNDLFDSQHYRASGLKRFYNTEKSTGGSFVNPVWLIAAKASRPKREVKHRTCQIGGQLFTLTDGRKSFEGAEEEQYVISKSLQMFSEEVRRKGGEFAVAFIPTKYRVLAPICAFPIGSDLANVEWNLGPLRKHLSDWSQSNGISLLDLTEALQMSAKIGEIPWFWGDGHWNEIGNSVATKELQNWDIVKRHSQK